jgi:hypothetical protein
MLPSGIGRDYVRRPATPFEVGPSLLEGPHSRYENLKRKQILMIFCPHENGAVVWVC